MKTFLILFLLLLQTSSYANKADVLSVKYHCNTNRICNFDVTIKHEDKGWKHYADAYEILTPDGKMIAKRVLYHPHVQEQPFTRNISDVAIPKEINRVIIRAHDSKHGYGGKEILLDLK